MGGLWNETGHSSIDDRNSEAIRLVDELLPQVGLMRAHEIRFVEDMKDKIDRVELRCAPKQLFWLRDLYSKYVLEE